ncbi:MAG: nitroreductase family protein [Caldilineaceae bacterium]
MFSQLALTPDELLTTTRSVRKRLDFARPVERTVIEECLKIAQQAPTGSNLQNWHFVVITDPAKRLALAEVYRKGWAIYTTLPIAAGNLTFADPQRNAQQAQVMASAQYLADHMHEAPVLVIPCIALPGARVESQAVLLQTSMWGSIAQAGWSFMLAARARGLGATWTTVHLFFEEEAAQIIGLPYAQVNQAALIPVAYTKGTTFKPASRAPLDTMVHWEAW